MLHDKDLFLKTVKDAFRIHVLQTIELGLVDILQSSLNASRQLSWCQQVTTTHRMERIHPRYSRRNRYARTQS